MYSYDVIINYFRVILIVLFGIISTSPTYANKCVANVQIPEHSNFISSPATTAHGLMTHNNGTITLATGMSDADLIVSKPKMRWAIVALARPGRSDSMKRNRLLADALRPHAKKHNITVIIFSEKVFNKEAIFGWQNSFKGIAKVVYINTSSKKFTSGEPYGYKYMCKFFSLDIYDYLRDNFDYYMRCDTDCYITHVKYDLLEWIEKNNVGYGFAIRKLEAHGPTKETLPKFVENYIEHCGVTPTGIMDRPLSTCFNFYNNWHIGQVSFFTRPDVRHFLEAVNASGKIISHRWGDSTIQAYAVRLFMQPNQIRQIPNFKYIHGSHGNKLISTFNNGDTTKLPQKLPFWRHQSLQNGQQQQSVMQLGSESTMQAKPEEFREEHDVGISKRSTVKNPKGKGRKKYKPHSLKPAPADRI